MSEVEIPISSSESDGQQSIRKRFWATRLGRYGTGAVLIYATCVLLGGALFSNEFTVILKLGLLMGTFLLIVFGPVHFLLQFLGHLTFSRSACPRSSIEGILLNVPALFLLGYVLIATTMPWTQSRLRRSLQAHFDHPLPASVYVKSFLFRRGMNEGSYTYLLSINPGELENLLSNSRFAITDAEVYLRLNSNQVLRSASAEFNPPYTVYAAYTNDGNTRASKFIVVNANRTDVAFIESFF